VSWTPELLNSCEVLMKIAVCIKQVVTREWQLRVNDQKTWIRDQDASFELNEPDAYALEEGLRLKEKHGGEVIVCCAGPARAKQVLAEELARGAGRAGAVGSASRAPGAPTAGGTGSPTLTPPRMRARSPPPSPTRSGPNRSISSSPA